MDFPELPDFKILQRLGHSPKGVIYKARRLVENDVVALKIFHPQVSGRNFIECLSKNAETSFLLEHIGLVRSLGFQNDDGHTLLIMEYVPGDSLAVALKRQVRFAPSQAMYIIHQCANVLKYATLHHCNHGRLHTADVLLGDDSIRLLGVGLGERPEHPAWSASASYPFEPLLYTSSEAMPSREFPKSPTGKMAVDMYALGALLYHVLTGNPPFRGSDEAELLEERGKLGLPVQWPAESDLCPPLETVVLTERMMASNPATRPTYDELIPALTKAISTAKKNEAAHAPLRVASVPLPFHSNTEDSKMNKMKFPTARPNGSGSFWKQESGSRSDLLYNVLWGGLAISVSLLAVAFAIKVFFYDATTDAQQEKISTENITHGVNAARSKESKPTPVPIPETPTQAIVIPLKPAPSEPPAPVDAMLAAHQLGVIQDLLDKNDIQRTTYLLKTVKDIAERAGKDTPAGVKAILLSAEIEESLIRNFNTNRAAALNIPPSIEPVLAPAFAEKRESVMNPTIGSSPPMQGSGQVATPSLPSILAGPVARNLDPNDSKDSTVAVPLDTGKPVEATMIDVLPSSFANITAKAKKFQYDEAWKDLNSLLMNLQGNSKKIAEAYATLLKQERALFDRCHQKLLDYIERDPGHHSIVQVYPKKNEPGDDIIDFDDKGLKILSQRGSSREIRVRNWVNIPDKQAFNLLDVLAEKKTAEDHLGLAVLAFNRGLKDNVAAALSAARELPAARDRCDALIVTFELLTKALEEQAGARTTEPTK